MTQKREEEESFDVFLMWNNLICFERWMILQEALKQWREIMQVRLLFVPNQEELGFFQQSH